YIGKALALVCVIILAPITTLGTQLPLIWRLAGSGIERKSLGNLTSINTIGAALGALAASFFFLPLLDLYTSLLLVPAALVLVAFFALYCEISMSSKLAAVALTCLLGGTWFYSEPFLGLRYDQTLIERFTSSYGWIDVIEYEDSSSIELRQNV